MNEEMRAEAIEMSITACEKYAPNYEVGGFVFFFINYSNPIKILNYHVFRNAGCGENDQRNNGQKIWFLLACSCG